MKPIVWVGDSLVRVRAFPADAKRELGYQLERVQDEREPADWKPIQEGFRRLIRERTER